MDYTSVLKKMRFIIGEEIDFSCKKECFFTILPDHSLIYNGESGDYSVFLGGDWRFELIIDSASGKCIKFQSQLYKMPLRNSHLNIPNAEKRSLYFKADNVLTPFSGCHYLPFCEAAYFDKSTKILCIGNPDAFGRAIEFSPNIVAIIDDENLNCIYLRLSHIITDIASK